MISWPTIGAFEAAAKAILGDYSREFRKLAILLEEGGPRMAIEYSSDPGRILASLCEKGIVKQCLKLVDTPQEKEAAIKALSDYSRSRKVDVCRLQDLPSCASSDRIYDSFWSFFKFTSLDDLTQCQRLLKEKGYCIRRWLYVCWGHRAFGGELKDLVLDLLSAYALQDDVRKCEREMSYISRADVDQMVAGKPMYSVLEVLKPKPIRSSEELLVYLEHIHTSWKSFVGPEAERVIKRDLKSHFARALGDRRELPQWHHLFAIYCEDEPA